MKISRTNMNFLLNDWSFRNLSIMGKVTGVKSLALPILIQILTVLSNPPNHCVKEFKCVIFNFVSNGKKVGVIIKMAFVVAFAIYYCPPPPPPPH